MQITPFFPLLSALFVLALGLMVFFHGERTKMNFTFVLFALAITAWLFGTFMMFLEKGNIEKIIFWDKFVYVGVVFIPAIMYHFGLALTGDISKRRELILNIGYLLSFFFLILLPTRLFVDGAFVYDWGAHSKAQPLHTIFLAYFATYLLLWFRMVYAYRKKGVSSVEISKIKFVFVGFAILAVFGSMGFLPAYGIYVYPSSYISGVLFTAILAFTIFRFQLFNIKIITAEVLVFIILILISLQAVITDAIHGWVLNAAVLSLASALGIFLIRSVYHEVRAREQIEKQEHELEDANRRQENLIHFISHEVKGYLAKSEAAFAAIDEGDYGPVSPELKTMDEAALKETRKGVETVMDILSAGDLKKGTLALDMRPFDVRIVVACAVESLRAAAQAKNLTLSCEGCEGDAVMVNGDKKQFEKHVIGNLLNNAILYTATGSVDVSLSEKDGVARVAITDTGIGLSDDDKTRLFTEGGRGADSLKTNPHSTGYGLFIAKQIVDAHRGHIRAESEGVGHGSTFTVELPLAHRT